MNKYSKVESVENYLSEMKDSESKKIILKVREIILSCDKGITEDIKWGSITFKKTENFCGFKVGKAGVALVVFNGAKLKDKFGLFNTKSSGEKTMTIKWIDIKEVNDGGLKNLMYQSANTPVK